MQQAEETERARVKKKLLKNYKKNIPMREWNGACGKPMNNSICILERW